MPEVFVNRIPETWGMQNEKARLESETESQIEKERLSQSETESQAEEKQPTTPWEDWPNKYEYKAYESRPISETEEPDIQDMDEAREQSATEYKPGNETPITEELKGLVNRFRQRDPDLIVLRQQVIQAFKHLGLDTRKFFGE